MYQLLHLPCLFQQAGAITGASWTLGNTASQPRLRATIPASKPAMSSMTSELPSVTSLCPAPTGSVSEKSWPWMETGPPGGLIRTSPWHRGSAFAGGWGCVREHACASRCATAWCATPPPVLLPLLSQQQPSRSCSAAPHSCPGAENLLPLKKQPPGKLRSTQWW